MKRLLLILGTLAGGLILMGCSYTISQNVASGHATERLTDTRETETKLDTTVKGSGSFLGL